MAVERIAAGNLFLALEIARQRMISKGDAQRLDFTQGAVRFTHVSELPVAFFPGGGAS